MRSPSVTAGWLVASPPGSNEVPDGAWERPAPCEGWVARDVVRHLVEWIPAFLASAGGPPLPEGPSVDDDPAGAWNPEHRHPVLLDDPVASATQISHPRAGTHRLDEAIATFFLGDVGIHTWDLARATGLDETLDADVVHDMLVGMEPLDESCEPAASTDPGSRSPPTPTSRPGSSPSPADTLNRPHC